LKIVKSIIIETLEPEPKGKEITKAEGEYKKGGY